MQDDHAGALELAGRIYDAALDPGHWPDALRRVGEFIGGKAAALISHDAASHRNRFIFAWGDNPEYSRLHAGEYACLSPILLAVMRTKVGEVWSIRHLMPTDEFHQTAFYRDCMKPRGYGDIVGTFVERCDLNATMFAMSLDECSSPASRSTRQRVELIAPHLRRALAMNGLVEASKVKARALGDAIDALDAAVYLLGPDGRIVHANVRGRILIEAGELLAYDHDGRLGLVVEHGRRDFARALGAIGSCERGVFGQGTTIPVTDRKGERYVAYVQPLSVRVRRWAGRTNGAYCAVFVYKAEMKRVFPVEAVAGHFDLSRAELRVLAGVLEVGPPAEVAPVLGLSEATVRTHLRHLFEKTGTARQADLVKLVAGYSGPVGTSDDRMPAEAFNV